MYWVNSDFQHGNGLQLQTAVGVHLLRATYSNALCSINLLESGSVTSGLSIFFNVSLLDLNSKFLNITRQSVLTTWKVPTVSEKEPSRELESKICGVDRHSYKDGHQSDVVDPDPCRSPYIISTKGSMRPRAHKFWSIRSVFSTKKR
eukprot:119110_1